MSNERLRDLAVQYAWSLIGKPYIWGGQHPARGFDCSGLINWILSKLGIFERGFDTTAHGLWRLLRLKRILKPRKGTIVFYGSFKRNRVTHVMFCIDEDWCIGATGGNSSIRGPDTAWKRKACVDLKRIRYRSDIWGYADPFMEA